MCKILLGPKMTNFKVHNLKKSQLIFRNKLKKSQYVEIHGGKLFLKIEFSA